MAVLIKIAGPYGAPTRPRIGAEGSAADPGVAAQVPDRCLTVGVLPQDVVAACWGRRHGNKAAVGDLEHSTAVEGEAWAAAWGRPEQIAVDVGNEAGNRVAAIGAIKTGHDGRRAGIAGSSPDDLEYTSLTASAYGLVRPEQVAVGVGDQAAAGADVGQCDGRAGVAGRRIDDFEHRAKASRPSKSVAPNRSPLPSAIRLPADVAGERDRRARVTGCGFDDLEYGSRVIGAASVPRAEQVRLWRPQSGSPEWKGAVRAVEADQRRWGVRVTACGLLDLEHGAVAVAAAAVGCAEQIAVGVGD
jgi:hypothetical protein